MKNGIMNGKQKRAVKPAEQTKVSKNLSLTQDVIDQGEKLAREDRRDFSAEVSWLIDQEHARRFEVA